ncbi:DUF1294 domain-containing protein [Desulfitobacterium sp.]|uniref:DUF1294 domain-containing protein n=1 Tax=Desulfitobacterium sp. TaxID=49981 RepID=UPI002D12AD09|nr:DUF1294 domain-containing protein [Desulfitobacterium sp.]HVJ48533.1 DUF1294 domain-containing protein [Desulfitobacterium sp.]
MLVVNIVLLVWNLVTCLLMGIDKHRAKNNSWRIPEVRLLSVALLGGALGIFVGMQIFHHKTKHPKFTVGIPLLLLINVLLYYGLWKFFR